MQSGTPLRWTRTERVKGLALVVAVVFGAAPTGVSAEESSSATMAAAERVAAGRHIFDEVRTRYPQLYEQAIARARARGWKPTEIYEGVHVPGQSDRMRKVPVVLRDHQDYASVWGGEIAVWYWEDGNPYNFEYQLYVRSYQTGEDAWVEGSFEPTSDWDGWHRWFGLIGGTRYSRERQYLEARFGGGGQVSDAKRRCVGECLKGKVEDAFRSAGRAASVSLLSCIPAVFSPAPGAGYFFCIGSFMFGSLAQTLIDKFLFQDDCQLECGVTGGGGGWELAACVT